MLNRICTSFKPSKITLGLTAGSLLMMNELQVPQFFWGFGSRKKSSEDKTATYIWGNGHYQSKPGRAIQFSNFKPKKIRTFNGKGDSNPYMK